MKPEEKMSHLELGRTIAGIALIAVFLIFGLWFYNSMHEPKSTFPMYTVTTTPTPTPTIIQNTVRIFTVTTPTGLFRDDSLQNISMFAENRYKGQVVHYPLVEIAQYPGVPVAGTDLATFIAGVSDPNSTVGTAQPKDCSSYIANIFKVVDQTDGKNLTQTFGDGNCWFYGVKKVEKMSSIGGFPTVKFSTANASSGSDSVAVDVTSGGKHYLVVLSDIVTGMSDTTSDKALKAGMSEIIKNISFTK